MKKILFFVMLAMLLGKGTLAIASWIEGDTPPLPDFSNAAITTTSFYKGVVSNVVNNAPFVFEGRMIKRTGKFYLFEVEKVYRGGEKLRAGTVELAVRYPDMPVGPLVSFSSGWHVIFAKEVDMPGEFDANNAIKLELYNDNINEASYLRERSGYVEESRTKPARYYTGLPYYDSWSLNFKTREDVRSFLGSYGLYPKDMPTARAIKTLSKKEIKQAEEKAVRDSAEAVQNAERGKNYYRHMLESAWQWDSISGVAKTRKGVEDAMSQYDNATDDERKELTSRAMFQFRRSMARDAKRRHEGQSGKKKSSLLRSSPISVAPLAAAASPYPTMLASIQNNTTTEDAQGRYLEFDIMLRTNTEDTYLYMVRVDVFYQSPSNVPFKQYIATQTPPEVWVTPGAMFTGYYDDVPKFYVYPSGLSFTHLSMDFDQLVDGEVSFEMPTSDVLFAHVKMKINGDYSGSTYIKPELFISPRYNTSPVANYTTSGFYEGGGQLKQVYLAPSTLPIITNYYINTPGNISGCAGCGDVLFIKGKRFGEKDINSEDVSSTLSFILADYQSRVDTAYYKLQENYDYISWSDTLIKVKLPSVALILDSTYANQSQYPGTGRFKVINGDKEAVSDSIIEINYVHKNWYSLNEGGKIPLPIPQKGCFNGYKFQVSSELAADTLAIACIKKAMKDWSDAMNIQLELELDTMGKPVVNPNTATAQNYWISDAIHTISYSTQVNLMAVRPNNFKWCNDNLGYFQDLDIAINNVSHWQKQLGVSPSPSQLCFYTAFLHELGHVVGLGHVRRNNNADELMQTTLIQGEKRTLDANTNLNTFNGATRIMEISENSAITWCDGLQPLNSSCTNALLNPASFEVERAVNSTLVSRSFDFTIAPNPSNGSFTIALPHEAEAASVEVFNMLGLRVGKAENAVGSVSVNRTDLPNGIYFVRVSANGKSVTKKLVIQQ